MNSLTTDLFGLRRIKVEPTTTVESLERTLARERCGGFCKTRNCQELVIPSEARSAAVEIAVVRPNGSRSGRLRFLDSLRSLGMT